jgi:hypothetical protein
MNMLVSGMPKLKRLLNNKINVELRGLQRHIRFGSKLIQDNLMAKQYLKSKRKHDLHLVL